MVTPLGACIAQADIKFDRFEHSWPINLFSSRTQIRRCFCWLGVSDPIG